jgi:pyruvate ferredoxin oxidoreductase beta subunit
MEIPKKLRPVEDYLKLQGRFRHLNADDIEKVQALVNKEWRKLMNKVACMKPW